MAAENASSIAQYASSIDRSSQNSYGQASGIEEKLERLASRQRDAEARLQQKQIAAHELAKQLERLQKLSADVDWLQSKGTKPDMSSAEYLRHLQRSGVDPAASTGDESSSQVAGGFDALASSVEFLKKWENCRGTVGTVAKKSATDFRKEARDRAQDEQREDSQRRGKVDKIRQEAARFDRMAAEKQAALEQETARESDLRKQRAALDGMCEELELHKAAWFGRTRALELVLRAVNAENEKVEHDLAAADATVDEMIGSLEALLAEDGDQVGGRGDRDRDRGEGDKVDGGSGVGAGEDRGGPALAAGAAGGGKVQDGGKEKEGLGHEGPAGVGHGESKQSEHHDGPETAAGEPAGDGAAGAQGGMGPQATGRAGDSSSTVEVHATAGSGGAEIQLASGWSANALEAVLPVGPPHGGAAAAASSSDKPG